tara:strand:- start:758 stop:961 length:204 start_codon:yes stop_codon:yes gene_type:complete
MPAKKIKPAKKKGTMPKSVYKKGGATKAFKPHMMYNPKTGKGTMAKKMADHLRMKKLGFGHTKPKKK